MTASSLLTGGSALVIHLSLDFRGAMALCLCHSQTLKGGDLASMRRVCNTLLTSAAWALALWLIVLERRTSCKGLCSSEVSSIICNGLVVLFGQAAHNAGRSCVV